MEELSSVTKSPVPIVSYFIEDYHKKRLPINIKPPIGARFRKIMKDYDTLGFLGCADTVDCTHTHSMESLSPSLLGIDERRFTFIISNISRVPDSRIVGSTLHKIDVKGFAGIPKAFCSLN